jgi:predicted metal-binding membrane protein
LTPAIVRLHALAVILSRQAFAVTALLAGALACWIVAFHGMSMMGGLGPFVGVWITTMAAMMLPSVTPMVVAYTGIGGERASTPVFVLGYLAVWTTYGLAAYLVAMELPDWSWLAGVGLLIAGLYQLTPLKNVCLRNCRAPLGFVMRRWRSGFIGAFSMGVEHGASCAGCCTGLMVALFALGMTSLAWMAAVALLILLEKALPGGERAARVTGFALIAAGTAVLA